MEQKAFTLHNRGMNRDLSISKAGESSAYENHNIRIIARDRDTLLSVTNERGNKEINLSSAIEGELVGWNVLNNHIILFTTDGNDDYIYRIDYSDSLFRITYGGDKGIVDGQYLYKGHLGFSTEHPIESIVYHETENIQKIYWLDGENPFRFMNFTADAEEVENWKSLGDDTYFDSNRPINFTVSANIEKDNSGNKRANGTTQYLLTYFNKHGQETGVAWVSDLVYLSPLDSGGAADGENSNKITLTFSNLDKRFTNFRVYSIFRSSKNLNAVAYIVGEGSTGDSAIIVDDSAHLVAEDISRLLYLGSKSLKAGTMTHKDQTLFLGDLKSTGEDYSDLETILDGVAFSDRQKGISGIVSFVYSDDIHDEIKDIPYYDTEGTYAYNSQLIYSSSDILTFKGGEKYRFALTFRTKNGTQTRAFWIGDKENTLYPVIDTKTDPSQQVIKRVVAKCTLPLDVINAMSTYKLETVQLMIAEATYADRSVKAQGILNPTMFNVWERYNSRLYSMPSWITRPKGNSSFANMHFQPVKNSNYSYGEIQCNYWETEEDPTPYYRIEDNEIVDTFDGIPDYDFSFVIYGYLRNTPGSEYADRAIIILAKLKLHNDANYNALYSYTFSETTRIAILETSFHQDKLTKVVDNAYFDLYAVESGWLYGENKNETSKKGAWAKLYDFLTKYEDYLPDPAAKVDFDTVKSWFDSISHVRNDDFYKVYGYNTVINDDMSALNFTVNGSGKVRWVLLSSGDMSNETYDYKSAFFRKHLMFVDENIVTLNSPEFDYEAVSIDNVTDLKLRVVGVAKITGSYSDYTVDISHGHLAGENLIYFGFSDANEFGNLDGLTSWPLWKETMLAEKSGDNVNVSDDVKKRDSDDYTYGGGVARYWLHMWHHAGKIDGFVNYSALDEKEGVNDYSSLRSKTFANMRFSNCTMYNTSSSCVYEPDVRMFNYLSSQYVGINVGGEKKYYDGNPLQSLSLPGSHSYPLLFSPNPVTEYKNLIPADTDVKLYSTDPVQIQFYSNPHAVLSLGTSINSTSCTQKILPRIFDVETVSFDGHVGNNSGALIPWEDITSSGSYRYKDYFVDQPVFGNTFDSRTETLNNMNRYVLIGELYQDYSAPGSVDVRYGGTSRSNIENNRFISAGPEYSYNAVTSSNVIYANQGDTYFQRWDCMKTKPVGASVANNVIDVTSVMVETHINIDGRTDKLRGTKYLASIDAEKFGSLNPVYSQQNNYFMQRILDEDANLDAYRSSITWTLDKQDSADVDEWTHITLANSLKLDGDKGICRALRRIGNSIIAFQDRGISEVLFNSRTQLSTTNGVPVEIANSGKVDGKRYITNKYGCLNKWSIVEGKAALYFVDNINKAFCSFNGQAIDNLSERLGFGVWFRSRNDMEPWKPSTFNNIVSYYDRIYSDIYMITNKIDDDMPCLVYNETLGAFTSFFDYDTVPMLANVEDKFIAYKNTDSTHRLWLQNEGLYCNFFGNPYGFWVNYRVTPDPYGDKIWTNIDYRADYYRLLDSTGTSLVPEEMMINGEFYNDYPGTYQENKTFDSLRVWNEYQNTGEIELKQNRSMIETTRKKFRIWRITIPRSLKTEANRHGLDRIRNPWINILMKKNAETVNTDMMQIHDVTVRYFE